jgi:hypothetical protein
LTNLLAGHANRRTSSGVIQLAGRQLAGGLTILEEPLFPILPVFRPSSFRLHPSPPVAAGAACAYGKVF